MSATHLSLNKYDGNGSFSLSFTLGKFLATKIHFSDVRWLMGAETHIPIEQSNQRDEEMDPNNTTSAQNCQSFPVLSNAASIFPQCSLVQ